MSKFKPRVFQRRSDGYSVMMNKLAFSVLDKQAKIKLVADFIAYEDDSSFTSTFAKLFELRHVREQFAVGAKKIEQLQNALVITGLPQRRLWQLYVFFLKRHSSELSQFARYRDQIENLFLLGKHLEIEPLLDQCNEKFGESLWYIRTKLLLLSGLGKNTELSEFSANCKRRAGPSLFQQMFHFAQLLVDADNPSLILQSIVRETTNELHEAKLGAVASLLELLFIPYPLSSKFDAYACLERIQVFPLIDQYELLTRILQTVLVTEGENNVETYRELKEIVGHLAAVIDDPLLRQINSYNQGTVKAELCSVGEVLIKFYNEGNYGQVVALFDSEKEALKNPLAYINLIAKSRAYLDFQNDASSESNLLENLINHLSTIYQLGKFWPQSEEALVSAAIKYLSLRSSIQIQLALYKVLPYKYSGKNPDIAARLASSSSMEITPLTAVMTKSTWFAAFFSETDEPLNVPLYRRLKQSISKAMIDGANQIDFEDCFRQLREVMPLTKDFIELISEYCLKTKQEEVLIGLAASMLVEDANRYVCFPLRELMLTIEERRLASIDAVMVSYFYARNVSMKLDYVLHEAFEEFLQSKDVRRPSELLSMLPSPSATEVAFFRDVCSPEVMDFLSCFDNNIDLHAERLKILDLLLERDSISGSARMREVEEIVQQVVVDAGASEFNAAKIYVDDQAIRKKCQDEIDSLLVLYKTAKDTGEDRMVIFDDMAEGGGKQAYVSGNKNSLILKMYSVLAEPFQFDEKYGLDKNVSAEIRHGFFSNLMRASLEKYKLITEANDDGLYKDNFYWRQKNALLHPEFWESIETHLKLFSSRFNLLVTEAEEWMKFVSGANQPSRVFNFVVPRATFEEFKAFVEKNDDPDKVSLYIMKIMWGMTDHLLETMREKINGEFRDRVDKLFEDLEIDLINAKKDVALAELMSTFKLARNEIKDDITTAAEWFRRVENVEFRDHSLDHVVEIAINSFERVKRHAFAISKSIPAAFRDIKVSGGAVKPFVIAITNLLDNCYRRSGLGDHTMVEVNGTVSGRRVEIRIGNQLSHSKIELLTPQYLQEINSRIVSPEARILVRSEGGTGLVKAQQEISSVTKNATVNVLRNESHFETVIGYEL